MQEPALGLRGIELPDLVGCLGAVAQRLIAVGEALRHVESTVVVLGQLNRGVLEVGRTLGPQVHNDVEDGAARAAHELGFSGRRILEMHPPHSALLHVEGNVCLGDERAEPVSLEFSLTEGPREEPARVLPAFHVDDVGTLERRFGEYHGS